jgi:DNA-binding CsgD family transcriptional regulator
LLRQEAQPDGEPRLVMLATMREYALTRLADEAAAVHHAHATYFLSLAEAAQPHLAGPEQAVWLDRLELEHHNLRAALHWAIAQAEGEMAVRLGAALWRFWFARGYMREGRHLLAKILELPGDIPLASRARLLQGAGVLAANQDHYILARGYSQEALALYRQLGDREGEAAAIFGLGNAAIWLGEYEEASTLFAESMRLYGVVNNEWGLTRSLAYLACVHWFADDTPKARPLFVQALTAYRAMGDQWGIAFTQYGLAFAAMSEGDYPLALDYFLQAHAILEGIGDRRGLIRTQAGLGRLALLQADLATAREKWLAAISLTEELGVRWGTAVNLDGLAGIAVRLGHGELAARLFGAAANLRTRLGVPQPPTFQVWYDQDIAQAHQLLEETAFNAAWHDGERATVTELVAAFTRTIPPLIPDSPGSSQPAVRLSRREQEVLRLVSQGFTDAQVAEQLVVSVRTIHAHLQSIYNKLGVANRMAAVHLALTQKLV